MEFEKMNQQSRRDFLKKFIQGSTALSVVLMYPVPSFSTEKDKKKKANTNYVYLVDIGKCIGCGKCVKACRTENNVPADFFRTWVERYLISFQHEVFTDSPKGGEEGFQPKKIKGEVEKGFYVPKLCNHCSNTPCVQVCPVSASYKSPENFILVDKERCIGCGYCVQACPYGSRYISPNSHTADKCTWCYHRITKGLQNACVQACPREARLFGDLNNSKSKVSKVFHRENLMVLKPHLMTNPQTYYKDMAAEVI
ncbi:MAG: 4Fe-4S dicluster domain-containing protein [Nitrospinae bacterium]|nr:4Fe-4S dicluster domain-containing protein [Nitrospinota bacterium]